ncbi:hypothetical protein N7465_003554, partial [Penicillium sp. CMV-2018d]
LKITGGFIEIQVNIAIKVRPVNAKLRGWHRLHHYFSRPQVIAWLIAPEILFESRGLEGRDFRATQNSWTCESGVAILTNSNDERPGHAAAEPANLPNPCQFPGLSLF